LRGKQRRRAAGAALQDIMTEMMVRTMITDVTLFEALAQAKATRDVGKPIVRDSLGCQAVLPQAVQASQVLGAKLAPLAPPGEASASFCPIRPASPSSSSLCRPSGGCRPCSTLPPAPPT
jgi:acyl-[acyl-carrier-protein]-phospholipid O-acyltransferase / long-chain-fatty-acid--[acyl-carrier-protein] ligase